MDNAKKDREALCSRCRENEQTLRTKLHIHSETIWLCCIELGHGKMKQTMPNWMKLMKNYLLNVIVGHHKHELLGVTELPHIRKNKRTCVPEEALKKNQHTHTQSHSSRTRIPSFGFISSTHRMLTKGIEGIKTTH